MRLQIYDGFSASVIYGLESYGFCKEGEALNREGREIPAAALSFGRR